MKYSKQRELILETLRQNPSHPTAEQVFDLVRQKDSNISLATVYRNLNQLADNGIIRKIDYLDEVSHFDHTLTKHYHFICTSCSKVIDIDNNIIPHFCEQIAEQTGLVVTSAEFFFKGICPNCRNIKKQ